ncbi:MAG: NGG1p interacting factor NIF3 [Candidatus Omnitrophota bacterium]
MKLGEIYKFFVKEGIVCDPRGKKVITKQLKDQKSKYRRLSKDDKSEFDLESFKNPYADTRILHGDSDREIKSILIGIDIDVSELLLADKFNSIGKEIDLVIAHHPRGSALAGFYDVMHMQKDILVKFGMDGEVAKDFLEKRIKEVERSVLGANHNRAVDAARLLDIAFMCVHTPADNHVNKYLNDFVKKKKPKMLKDLIKAIKQIPEYRLAAKDKAGPKIIIGKPEDKVGKLVLEMTGGTEGSKDLFARLSQLGIKTIVSMHLSEQHFAKAKPEHINAVVAGHISSDNLGLNLLLDKLEQKDRFMVMGCSGFRRIRR